MSIYFQKFAEAAQHTSEHKIDAIIRPLAEYIKGTVQEARS